MKKHRARENFKTFFNVFFSLLKGKDKIDTIFTGCQRSKQIIAENFQHFITYHIMLLF